MTKNRTASTTTKSTGNAAARIVEKQFPPSEVDSVLDYGTGRGEALQIFSEAGYKMLGTDTDSQCVEIASEYGEAVPLNIEDPVAQFGEKSHDVVICFHVLEHVPNPREVASQLSKIARKAVVVAVPNLSTLVGLFRRRVKPETVNEGHLQSWDHAHFQSLMERHCGLELIEWGFDATILPVFNRFGPKLLGNKGMIWLETGCFRKLFPFHGLSVLGIFRPKD